MWKEQTTQWLENNVGIGHLHPYSKKVINHISTEIIEKIADEMETTTAFAGRGIGEYIRDKFL